MSLEIRRIVEGLGFPCHDYAWETETEETVPAGCGDETRSLDSSSRDQSIERI